MDRLCGKTDWMTLSQAAEYVGVCRQTVASWTTDGLRHTRIGKLVRIKRDWIDEYLEAHEANPPGIDFEDLKVLR